MNKGAHNPRPRSSRTVEGLQCARLLRARRTKSYKSRSSVGRRRSNESEIDVPTPVFEGEFRCSSLSVTVTVSSRVATEINAKLMSLLSPSATSTESTRTCPGACNNPRQAGSTTEIGSRVVTRIVASIACETTLVRPAKKVGRWRSNIRSGFVEKDRNSWRITGGRRYSVSRENTERKLRALRSSPSDRP
jgi:hypothetical protein